MMIRTIMMYRTVIIFILAFLFSLSNHVIAPSHAQGFITPEESQEHIGETQTVCGTVASTNYAISSKGQPTFLNLNKPYPNHIFTVVIWRENRAKFKNAPETLYKGKGICVKGIITEYRGRPQIEVQEPSQVVIK